MCKDKVPKLSELTEEYIVEAIAKELLSKPGPGEYLFYPEDARDLLPRGPRLLVSIDAYTIDSLKLPWRTYADVGWATLVGATSDVVSKGGIPYACLIALGLPRETSMSTLNDLLSGIKEASKEYSIKVLGGDTNESSCEWIAIATIGFTTARVPPSRSGLREGDVIVVTGIYGAMGFVAKHGIEHASRITWVIRETKRPRLIPEIGYVIENFYKVITASTDVSDGLGYTLSMLSKLSGYGIQLEKPPQVHKELAEYCNYDSECILEYALTGGEEYGVVLGVKEEWISRVVSELEYYRIPYSIVGRAVSSPPGVYFRGKKLEVYRYDQFRKWVQIS